MRTVKSPCIGVCVGLSNQTCKGCGRTFDEIAQWRSMADAEKQSVWNRIESAAALRYQKRDALAA